MDFVRSHFGKMRLWPVEHFFEHICHHFWVGLLLQLLHPPKSDDKYAQKSVQLVRGSSFRSDFLKNPYFSTLNSHPADWGSNPLFSTNFFFLFSLNFAKNQVLSIKKSKTQLKNCSFNFIIFTIFSMHLLHMMIKWSQKFWEIYCW